jgi:hypothetical protein
MIQINKWAIFLLLASFPIVFLLGYLSALDSAYNTGYKVAYTEMDGLLRQGVKGGLAFGISGLSCRFIPRADSLIVARDEGLAQNIRAGH